jgi:hypothetical protein
VNASASRGVKCGIHVLVRNGSRAFHEEDLVRTTGEQRRELALQSVRGNRGAVHGVDGPRFDGEDETRRVVIDWMRMKMINSTSMMSIIGTTFGS